MLDWDWCSILYSVEFSRRVLMYVLAHKTLDEDRGHCRSVDTCIGRSVEHVVESKAVGM